MECTCFPFVFIIVISLSYYSIDSGGHGPRWVKRVMALLISILVIGAYELILSQRKTTAMFRSTTYYTRIG